MSKYLSLVLISLVAGLTLSACGAYNKPPFHGADWKPVHRYSDTVNKIPIKKPQLYIVRAADSTLRSLLRRWAMESGAELVYVVDDDFSLPKAAAPIRTASLVAAVGQLHNVYRDHGIAVSLDVVNNTLYVKYLNEQRTKE